jgi:phenylacetate-CoA ligase
MNRLVAKTAVLWPVHYLRNERIASHLTDVELVHSLTPDELQLHHKRQLHEVLGAASESRIPLYRDMRWLKHRLASDDIIRVLEEFPLVSKEMLRSAVNSDPRNRRSGLDHRSTSGSTGLPFQFYKDRLATGYMEAVLYSSYAWHGIRIGDRQARFWGVPIGLQGKIISRTKDFLKNRIRFSAFDLSRAAKQKFYSRLNRFRPSYFYGYPSLIAEFCHWTLEEGKSLSSLPLKAVIGTGELVHDHTRELIERATGVPFVSEYGCTEVGLIGLECEHGSMHLLASNIFLEVIKEGRSVIDEEGKIYVTELHAKHFPFIRYGVGDRGIIESKQCRCGRSLPVFRILSGRADDYLITPEGAKVYDAIFAYVLKQGVDQFKAVQRAPNLVELFIKPNQQYCAELEQSYIRQLRNGISPSIEITINLVEEIPRSKAGKLRYFERTFALP